MDFIPRRENHDRKVVDEAIQINSAEGGAQGGRKTMGVSPWKFINLKNQKDLIREVIVFPLKVNRDASGILVETLKIDWPEVYSQNRPFAQNYYSVTPPGVARDERMWHQHPNQEDRFAVISGDIIVAIYDWRKESPTYGSLNLFKMGESEGDSGQYLLLIPKNTLHSFCVVSPKPAALLNFPTLLYNPKEEGRVAHSEVSAKFSDGQVFSWDLVKKTFTL
ncbi:MAG: dTDP-4-dehydrorhamnose 3,5-epimerase family protein [bacterium]|nr:dTDP-4-dehydrorhamnose 3,5-epimerase family protein [bacterium]